ncbi:MAG: SH3 domain-containing protein [Desulfobulbaceae bacterium]|nr:SH3 domain-containing protein [Desulfobulbaceae bacterium]MCK5545183.1 SH3 domain-containing protein [Desulfobulbaceae bacterium]
MEKQNSIGKRFWQGLAIFVIAIFFSSSSFAAEYISVKKDGVNIRSGPNTNTEILWEVFKDFPLQVLERKGKWIRIRDFEGDKGWIYSQLASKTKTVIVKVKTANMRVGPGKNYEIMATVKYGVVFKPVGKDGSWIKLSHEDGTTGWMFNTLIWPK